MPTVNNHAANIVAMANEIDPVVEQLRGMLREIAAEENALHSLAVREGPHVADHLAGRRGIATYAASLVSNALNPIDPPTPRQTTGELAYAAWQEFADL